MKIKALLSIPLISFSAISFAQSEITTAEQSKLISPNYYYHLLEFNTTPIDMDKEREKRANNRFKTQKTYSINKDGEKELLVDVAYDQKGRVIKRLDYSKEKYNGFMTTFNDAGKKESHDTFKKSKFRSGNEYTYDENGKLSSIKTHYKTKDEFSHLTLFEYNEDKRITRRETFGKNGDKMFSLYKYEYNANGDKATTYRYYKGKLKAKYSFRCDGAGADVKKKVEQEICTKSEFDKDGNRIEVTRRLNHKGEAIKTIFTYNKNNQLFRYQLFDKNENIRRKCEHTLDKNGRVLTTKVYNKGSEVPNEIYEFKYDENNRKTYHKKTVKSKTSEIFIKYDTKGNLTERRYKTKKSDYKYNYVYNSQNNVVSFTSKGLKNDYSKTYTYDNTNRLASYIYKDKKRENKKVIEYDFY